MVDIKQITNNSDNLGINPQTIIIHTPTGDKTLTIKYKRIEIDKKIIKLGYCCGSSFM